MKKLMVANWKMNKTVQECKDFFHEFNEKYTGKREAWVAPQSLHLLVAHALAQLAGIEVGAQNTSEFLEGAYTGEISPKALKDAGGSFVILGHSERREYFAESSKYLNAKVRAALAQDLKVIYCVGETLSQRESGQTLSLVADQLHQGLNDQSRANAENLIIAYEPVWAIGTGKTATPSQAQEVHAFIRKTLKEKFPLFGEKLRILYGGSVKTDNVEELLAKKDIDGGLVGGAALKSRDFLALCADK
jgi:triosephosphate isomerase (TIM)